jgi:hypothetical protein
MVEPAKELICNNISFQLHFHLVTKRDWGDDPMGAGGVCFPGASQTDLGGFELWAKCWRATVDENGHYSFAVPL